MTGTERAPARTSGSPLGSAVVCVPDGQQLLIARVLEDRGYEVLAALDRGLETLPTVAEYAPDVVVIDLALTGTLGLRLLEMIRTLNPRVAVVVMTAFPALRDAALAAGGAAVVPVEDLPALRDVLARLAGYSPSGYGTQNTNAASS